MSSAYVWIPIETTYLVTNEAYFLHNFQEAYQQVKSNSV